MSNPANIPHVSRRPPSSLHYGARWFILCLVILFVQISAYAVFDGWDKRLRLQGGLQLTLPPGTEAYLGYMYLGQGEILLPWQQLFADLTAAGSSPMEKHVVQVPDVWQLRNDGASGFSSAQGSNQDYYSQLLLGHRMEFLKFSERTTGGVGGRVFLRYANLEAVYRRANSQLDHLYVLQVELYDRNITHCYLIPLRIRPVDDDPDFYPNVSSSGARSTTSVFGSGDVFLTFGFTPGAIPEELPEPLPEQGLWKPAR